MFDDSKRLDAIEARLAAIEKWITGSTDTANKTTDVVNKLQDYTGKQFTQVNENTKITDKRVGAAELASKDIDAAGKKLAQRVATLEATVAKLKK